MESESLELVKVVNDDKDAIIEKQNEMIISLLGRIAFPEEELKKRITANSKKPIISLKAYNLCDGKTGLTEITKSISISQPAFTLAVISA